MFSLGFPKLVEDDFICPFLTTLKAEQKSNDHLLHFLSIKFYVLVKLKNSLMKSQPTMVCI